MADVYLIGMEALEAWMLKGVAGVAAWERLFVDGSSQCFWVGGSMPDRRLLYLSKLDAPPLLLRLLGNLLLGRKRILVAFTAH